MEIESEIKKIVRAAVHEELKIIDTATDRDEVLTAQEAVELIGNRISYGTLLRECRKGTLPCFRIGSRVFIRKARLLHWIEEQENHRNK